MGILKALFTVFLISFFLTEVGRIEFPNGVAVSLNDVLLFLTVITWISYLILNRKRPKVGFLTKPIIIFSGICLISLIINFFSLNLTDFLISFLYLLRWVFYALIYFIFFEFDKKFQKKLFYLAMFSGFLTVLGGFIQYYFYPNLRNLYYLGWDEHLYRMFSSFLDPDFAGAFFVILFVGASMFFIESFKNKEYIKRIIFFVLLLTSFVAIYLTYSRSAVLMLIMSSIVFLFLAGKKKLIGLALVILVAFIFVLPKSFQTEGTNFLRTASGDARIKSFNIGLKIFESSPVIGVGFDSYRYAQTRFGLNGAFWQTSHSGAGTDNSFLFVLATTGVLGFGAYCYLLYKIVRLGISKLNRNIFSLILISSLAGLIIDSLFLNSLFYIFVMEWVWILCAITESS